MEQNQPYSYEDAGYNPFFERDPRTYNANPRINAQVSLFIQSVADNSIIYDPFDTTSSADNRASSASTPGDQISGGVITSNNGNLSIDLNQGSIQYNDGITNLLSLGTPNAQGTPNSLTINNQAGQPIVQS